MEAEGKFPNTIRLHLAFLLSHLFNMARKEWGMEALSNPVGLIRKPKLPQCRDKRLVGNEESRLLADIVIFAIETVMRQGEIMDLEWCHINWLDHTAYLPETKNESARLVPLSERAEEALQRQQVRATGQYDKVW
ncbi:tyrosine-type recombinase/integrase [Acidithiobacillus sp. HP-6]|nr:tyrosine-type recombinase/integrase [Acidithiobacillus sp. HP-6]MBE7568979.1 tyrosine-type recombinase/integrase [Acidithiobacillus sp. HP-2]